MEIKMTAELQEKMIGLLPLDNETIDFIPDVFLNESDAEEDKAFYPTVTVRQMNHSETLVFKKMIDIEMRNNNSKTKVKVIDNTKAYIDLLATVVSNINNLFNIKTLEIIEYEGKKTLELLPELVITSILTYVVNISGFIPK